jgi:hypothetical protein
MRRAPPAHKATTNPPGQSHTRPEPRPLPFGHDSAKPRRLKSGRDPRSGSDGQP